MTRRFLNRPGRWLGLLVCILGALAGSGCRHAEFYRQAVAGQWEIWSRQRPVTAILAETNAAPELRQRLELAVELREFARRELLLEPGGSYHRYADLGRPFVTWTVTAAPEFSLEPKEWWYPVVGRLGYRGYFRKEEAVALARELMGEGWDVSVGGVTAYSTLGWLSDPLLNTYLFDPELALADVLFHELAHRRFFVAGDTEFNEAYATAVATEGVRRWIVKRGDSAQMAAWRLQREREASVRQILLSGRQRLEELYRTATDSTVAREQKARELRRIEAELQALVAEWGDGTATAMWLGGPLNNARLNDVATYHALVPRFEALLRECDGDLERWYRRIEEIGSLAAAKRMVALGAAGTELSGR